MTDTKRDPHADNDLIEDDLPVPSQGGSSGGELQRETGSIDEEKTATGADPQPTSVHKGQKPDDGDEPNLPNRGPTAPRRSGRRNDTIGRTMPPFDEAAACPFCSMS